MAIMAPRFDVLLDNVQAPCFDLIGRTHFGNDEG